MHHVLYVSRSSAAQSADAVTPIVDVSRANNRVRAISGALLFDGERFCQYIEGGEDDIARTFAAIEADERHTDIQVLTSGVIDERRFDRWSMAYVRAETPDVIDTIAGLPPAAIVDGFAYMLDRCMVET